MQMIFASLFTLAAAAVASAAPTTRAASCPEAARFGALTVTPTNGLAAGSAISGKLDLTCATQKGIKPEFIDYYLNVPTGNNGYEAPILLKHSTPASGAASDSFDTTLPYATYFDAGYNVYAQLTYPVSGSDGKDYYVTGGVLSPVKITPNNN
ncbi:hypothetical protein CONPUDRAFT_137576 [Coniophora puteana RWD-64-598 SS2]|uniref:Uncharacterized protein n=1 Tax=Coniophora puteana (strain RWD-64-598) TaxID=741705 RepID=A0A5M3MNF1_CONPW|nr:uncharacterized protein CONPUDRAFT_137576 [Coniophora puteana RWD-64-598 SS2]EIW80304.1 hypothetical protein CONPUDRAFT_137576 [Coniophora puteana RWD-64-598 SS2]